MYVQDEIVMPALCPYRYMPGFYMLWNKPNELHAQVSQKYHHASEKLLSCFAYQKPNCWILQNRLIQHQTSQFLFHHFFKLLPQEPLKLIEIRDIYLKPVSYTHLTLPTNR